MSRSLRRPILRWRLPRPLQPRTRKWSSQRPVPGSLGVAPGGMTGGGISPQPVSYEGYETQHGETWRSEYLVWPVSTFQDVDLSIDCDSVPMKLRSPMTSTRVFMPEGEVQYPLKGKYERVNAAIEGYEEAHDDGGEHDGDEPPPPPPPPPPPGSSKLKIVYKDPHPKHFSKGSAGDGVIYVDDDGNYVKLDKRGGRYRAREDGIRELPTSRPPGISSRAWSRMPPRAKAEAIRSHEAVIRAESSDIKVSKGDGKKVVRKGDEDLSDIEYEPSIPDEEADAAEKYARKVARGEVVESAPVPPREGDDDKVALDNLFEKSDGEEEGDRARPIEIHDGAPLVTKMVTPMSIGRNLLALMERTSTRPLTTNLLVLVSQLGMRAND